MHFSVQKPILMEAAYETRSYKPAQRRFQGRAEVLRATGALVFVQALVHADGEAVLRASGVLRRGEARGVDAAAQWDPLQLRQV